MAEGATIACRLCGNDRLDELGNCTGCGAGVWPYVEPIPSLVGNAEMDDSCPAGWLEPADRADVADKAEFDASWEASS